MRIIIEIDEESETTEAEIREESGSMETTRQEATDAGAAPESRPSLPEEARSPSQPPTETSERSGQATDAGAAPEPLPEPRIEEGTSVPSTSRATDAGAAPRSGQGSSSISGSSVSGGFQGQTPVGMAEGGTDAGPPPESLEGSSETDEGTAIDYEAIVSGTVDEVKDRVEGGDLDVKKVIEAERFGEARNTLLEWLEKREK